MFASLVPSLLPSFALTCIYKRFTSLPAHPRGAEFVTNNDSASQKLPAMKWLALGLVSIALSACNTHPAAPSAQQEAAKAQSVPVVESPTMEEAATQSTNTSKSAGLNAAIEELLAAADSALQINQLTTPAEDNAFDRYQAVLLLRPGNTRALEGLRQIGERYIALAQSATSEGDLGRARSLLERAREAKAESESVAALEAEIARRQRERPPAPVQPKVANDKEIILDPRALSRKDEGLQQQLKELARTISKTEESLVITVRNDAEGRWIYKLLNETVPEHRVRGDIRLGREPKIVLLPPIE